MTAILSWKETLTAKTGLEWSTTEVENTIYAEYSPIKRAGDSRDPK
jgi:hypothetical protein